MFDRLVDLLISCLNLFRFFTVVYSFEAAAKLTLGKNPKELPPGLHLIWPFNIDEVWSDVRVASVKKLEPQTITLRDGKTVIVRLVITMKIDDALMYFFSVDHSEAAMQDAALGAATQILQPCSWEELLADPPIRRLTNEIRKNARQWGIGVEKVGISDLALGRAHRLYIGTEEATLNRS